LFFNDCFLAETIELFPTFFLALFLVFSDNKRGNFNYKRSQK